MSRWLGPELSRLPIRIDRFWAGVVAISACAASFLALRLRAWPPHEDEALALLLGRQPLDDLFHTVLERRGGAPLHFLLTHAVSFAVPGLTGLRLISALFVVASIPVIAALVARLTNRATALLTCLLLAGSWVFLFHGVYGRMYGLFLFTSALSFLTLLVALARGTRGRWAVWALATLAALATQPYGALVLAVEAVYVLIRRWRRPFALQLALAAFAAVVLIATPLWRTYLVLASRFEVGVGGGEGGSRFSSPLAVLDYVKDALGDFSAGWTFALIPVLALAALGLWQAARTRPAAALLAGLTVGVPALALTLARLGSETVPETRHLIFAAPLFSMLVAIGLLELAQLAGGHGRALFALMLGVLLAAQIAWGWEKTPTLYAGEAPARTEARHQAAGWLAASLRPNDLLFAFDPLYLEAWQLGGQVGSTVVPRADAQLALRTVREARRPLGHGIWVLDASDPANWWRRRFSIEERPPNDAVDVQAFGPFLVLRSRDPIRSPGSFFRLTLAVERLGRQLGIAQAELNEQTALSVLRVLEGR